MANDTTHIPADELAPVLVTSIEDRVATIELHRPHRRNALNGELIHALDAAVRAVADDDEVKVVILTGAAAEGGTGGFCSGGDTRDGGDRDGIAVPFDALDGDLARHERHAAMLLHLMPKPTIAMIGGPAVGAGFSLAGACDLRYASTDATFRAGFTANGLSGDYGGTFFWTRIIGTARTRQLYLLDEKVAADRALELGMVHEVLPPEELAPRVAEVADRLRRMPAAIAALVKDNLNQAEDDRDRRQFLFANEAANQTTAGRRLRDLMARTDSGQETTR